MARRSARAASQDAVDHEPVILGPTRAEVRSAVEALPEDLPWDEMSSRLRPMFIRRRPMPPGAEAPVTFTVPPGLTVALGVDIGPAFLYVGPGVLSGWPVAADEAFDRALANLRATVEAERFLEMEYGTVADIPIWWYQSHGGLASGLLLLPNELARRYGDGPRLLIAPMRNLLLAAPFDADRNLVEWLRDEIAFEDPNGLDLPVFALIDGRLSIDRRARSHVRGALVH
ncbi:MAG TPA: hypothetical protein VIK00_05610 [Candidatus Limnocylindrales bacterium]